jgi:hypothetical protein
VFPTLVGVSGMPLLDQPQTAPHRFKGDRATTAERIDNDKTVLSEIRLGGIENGSGYCVRLACLSPEERDCRCVLLTVTLWDAHEGIKHFTVHLINNGHRTSRLCNWSSTRNPQGVSTCRCPVAGSAKTT